MALIVGGACLGYLLFVGTLVSGLLEPVGTRPPSTNAPASTGRDTGEARSDSGTPARADARGAQAGDRADRHDRRPPPAGRTAPPAGGPGQ
ncbi:hypothetical protein AB0Q95_44405 [Streptomyces sp. NPDC059900]|uniref:hypothetical protein n=1 Tax=Streptomyces sp. NPDC059900 TaxID=3155816 RepID=UPI0034324C13